MKGFFFYCKSFLDCSLSDVSGVYVSKTAGKQFAFIAAFV